VADHCSNIGIYIIQYKHDDSLRVHDYTHSLDKTKSNYEKLYRDYVSLYPIKYGKFSNNQ
jgi:hypothetical protein